LYGVVDRYGDDVRNRGAQFVVAVGFLVYVSNLAFLGAVERYGDTSGVVGGFREYGRVDLDARRHTDNGQVGFGFVECLGNVGGGSVTPGKKYEINGLVYETPDCSTCIFWGGLVGVTPHADDTGLESCAACLSLTHCTGRGDKRRIRCLSSEAS
jgi:hypothetical protein